MQKNKFLAVWLRMLAVLEIRLSRDFFKIFKSQATKIANAYSSEGHAASETVINEHADLIVRTLVAHYAVTIRQFAAFTAEYTGGTKADFQSLVQGFIARTALMRVKEINDTTKKKLTNIILDGQALGLGVNAIAKNITTELAGEFSKSRARTIARTETHTAAGFGSNAQALNTDYKTTKTWVATEDERTREAHIDADGQTVGSDDAFDVGDEALYYPGDPSGSPENIINCRCAMYVQPKTNAFDEGNLLG